MKIVLAAGKTINALLERGQVVTHITHLMANEVGILPQPEHDFVEHPHPVIDAADRFNNLGQIVPKVAGVIVLHLVFDLGEAPVVDDGGGGGDNFCSETAGDTGAVSALRKL